MSQVPGEAAANSTAPGAPSSAKREGIPQGLWLRCPECEVHRLGVFEQVTLDAFDRELDRGDTALREAYVQAVRENMAAEAEVFAHALGAGAILPEDF